MDMRGTGLTSQGKVITGSCSSQREDQGLSRFVNVLIDGHCEGQGSQSFLDDALTFIQGTRKQSFSSPIHTLIESE